MYSKSIVIALRLGWGGGLVTNLIGQRSGTLSQRLLRFDLGVYEAIWMGYDSSVYMYIYTQLALALASTSIHRQRALP